MPDQKSTPATKELSPAELTSMWHQAATAAQVATQKLAGHLALLGQICQVSGKPDGVSILDHLKAQRDELERLRKRTQINS